MDGGNKGFEQGEPFSRNDPNIGWNGEVTTRKRFSLMRNENLHYEGTYYLALKELFDHASAERIADASYTVDEPAATVRWFFSRHADIPHHLASRKVDGPTVRREALAHYRECLKKACAKLKAGAGGREEADLYLGRALHTLQDSFSHSDDHGNPMLSEEHDGDQDHPEHNAVKAGYALLATEKVLRKYRREIAEAVADGCPEPDCAACAYWDSEVLFKMSRGKQGARACR